MSVAKRPPRSLRRRARAFTLLELLVVLVIVGIIVSMASLSFGVLGRDRQAEDEARRFWAVMQQAREEAELQAEDVAVYVAANSYEYLRFDQRRNEWLPITDDNLYRPRELPEGLRVRLRLESREIVLKPTLPNRSDKDENKRAAPQVVVLSSGEIMPFEMEIERDGAPSLWRVTGLADNDLRVEQRAGKDGREWSMVVQTKEPDSEDDKKARTNAYAKR
jgi:general secretion pathway protein H